MKLRPALLLACLVLALPSLAQAHGDAGRHSAAAPARKEQKEWGIAGDAKAVSRTIEIRMSDQMRFVPERIEVREGQTIRLVHRNDGKLKHEFVLGTKKELDEHAALMQKFPDMEHDEPYMAHVAPGRKAEIIWHFNRAGEFEFACLIPGHYQAGMIGKARVLAKERP